MSQTVNTSANELMPRIIGDSRQYLRRKAGWLPILNHDFSGARAQIGQKVQVPIPPELVIQTLSTGQLPPVASAKNFPVTELTLDMAVNSEPVSIDQVMFQNYAISGPKSVLAQTINSAIDTVVGSIGANLAARYKEIPTFVGVGGRNFFNNGSAASIDTLADVRLAMNQQRVPQDRPIYGILNLEDEVAAMKIQEVRQAYSIGTTEVIQGGKFPSILGIGLKSDYFMGKHTIGTMSTGGMTSATALAGATSLVAHNGLGTSSLLAGDIVSLTSGGVVYGYAIQTATGTVVPSADVTLTFDRPLDVAATSGDTITFATNFGTGRNNIFGDMLGVSVVTRLPEDPASIPEMPIKILGDHYPIHDPISGVTLLLSFFGQFFQRTMMVSSIYGTKITHAGRLVRGLSNG